VVVKMDTVVAVVVKISGGVLCHRLCTYEKYAASFAGADPE
jgi:hypothetical protein